MKELRVKRKQVGDSDRSQYLKLDDLDEMATVSIPTSKS